MKKFIFSIVFLSCLILIIFLVTQNNKTVYPNALIIGVQKGGTSTLSNVFSIHKEIGIPEKEVHFFDTTKKKMDWYSDQFKNYDKKKVVCEKTPSYIYNVNNAIDKIYNFNPNIKLIILFREPISRAYSQYYMNINMPETMGKARNIKLLELTFRERILADLNKNNNNKKSCDILQRGYYDEQLSYIYSKFPKKNVFVGISEDLKENKLIYNKIFKFLNVKSLDINELNNIEDSNVGKKSTRKKYKEDEKFLYKLYKNHIENFYKIIGRRIPQWDEYHRTLV